MWLILINELCFNNDNKPCKIFAFEDDIIITIEASVSYYFKGIAKQSLDKIE